MNDKDPVIKEHKSLFGSDVGEMINFTCLKNKLFGNLQKKILFRNSSFGMNKFHVPGLIFE
uniref:CSON014842 protein n=1 Tax=Culicoides sonorensis TaxID=179676 RepID=A0A336MPC4_CULSO